jgi:hypothetical protein
MGVLSDVLHGAGYVLDTPGSLLRGLLAGRPGSRVSGDELIGGKPDDFTLGGFLTSLATDPLMLLGGAGVGAKLLGRGGKLARPLSAAVEAKPFSAVAEAKPLTSALPEAAAVMPAAQEAAPIWYSRTQQAIERMPESIKGESAVNYLKKLGAPPEELQWTRMGEAAKPGTRVGKADLAKHFDENKIVVEEKLLADNPEHLKRIAQLQAEEDALGRISPTGAMLSPEQHARLQQIQRELHETTSPVGSGPRYSNYKTPGGENYRELLLTIPKMPAAQSGVSPIKWRQSYQSSHWKEPNVIAHVRFQDKVGPQGQRILHIEEIQSDWHQAGKAHGYRKPGEAPLPKGYELEGFPSASSVPDAPFKENWHELAMKRMLRYAADNGYDAVGWSPGAIVQKLTGGKFAGQQQFYDQVLPGFVNKYAKQWGGQVSQATPARESLSQGELLSQITRPIAEEGARSLRMTVPDFLDAVANNPDAVLGRVPPLVEMSVRRRLAALQTPQPHMLPMNPQMREAIRRGQPLLNLAPWLAGGAAGGGALSAFMPGAPNG